MSSEAQALIESVVQVTGHRDRDSMELSLARTVAELLHPERVLVYRSAHRGIEEGVVVAIRIQASPARFVHAEFFPYSQKADFPRQPSECTLLSQRAEDGRFLHLLPLQGERDVRGYLEVLGPELETWQLNMLEALGRVYRNFMTLIDQGERDILTGLLNRRTFDASLLKVLKDQQEEQARERGLESRRREPDGDWRPWLAILDIDRFRDVNDRLGHVFGDEVLLLFARLMVRSFRRNDLLFRYGGNEFVVVLESAPESDAKACMERFRKSVEEFRFPGVWTVTCSGGMVGIKGDEPPAYLLDKAERALRMAKDDGHNRVLLHEDLVQQGRMISDTHSGEVDLF